MKTTLKTLTAAALATALVAGFASAQSANAQDQTFTPSRTIGYSDVNLSTQDGAKVLYKRIAVAATRLCRGIYPTPELTNANLRRECTLEAIEKAVQDVNAPTLTALYEGRDVKFAENK